MKRMQKQARRWPKPRDVEAAFFTGAGAAKPYLPAVRGTGRLTIAEIEATLKEHGRG